MCHDTYRTGTDAELGGLQVTEPPACIQLLSLPSICWPQLNRGALQQDLSSLAYLRSLILPGFMHVPHKLANGT